MIIILQITLLPIKRMVLSLLLRKKKVSSRQSLRARNLPTLLQSLRMKKTLRMNQVLLIRLVKILLKIITLPITPLQNLSLYNLQIPKPVFPGMANLPSSIPMLMVLPALSDAMVQNMNTFPENGEP